MSREVDEFKTGMPLTETHETHQWIVNCTHSECKQTSEVTLSYDPKVEPHPWPHYCPVCGERLIIHILQRKEKVT